MFGSKQKKIVSLEQAAGGLQDQVNQLNGYLQQIGGLDHLQVRQEIERMRAELAGLRQAHAGERQAHQQALAAERRAQDEALAGERRAQDEALALQKQGFEQGLAQLRAELAAAQTTLVPFTDELMFQDAGVFRYHHPLDNSEAYKRELDRVQDAMKQMIRDKTAVTGSGNFTFNGSSREGTKMVADWCKLMLRSYNAEAENSLRVMKAGSVDAAKKRLVRAAEAIEKLGKMLSIQINDRYERLRMRELELTADYLQKKQEEKEAERAERERLREEAKAQAEFRRELEKLEKERKHLENVRRALLAKGDVAAADELQSELDKVVSGIEGVHQREANIRAGYVYVISNLGAFGPKMVKIGMTRRLHPEERVLELGDASVPFRYDTHILHYSADAVSLETKLHQALSDRRVNRVNMRREFFYATPEDVRELLKKHSGQMLEYVLEPEAAEYRQSVTS
ncbi:DUF4041 domain-containing protein [Lentzea cavernae]|uniref:Bacteriophage T5 Orf172 DNA-binding domain-containing protein n=1 Tax=Lentzea cavernae TaxID=2020703 RepID=A0ABQ3MJ78_9PSEU|nr:DUF4041 domain-containing protein [Lentzea cavernae]GHH44626.1 hypothetical protein GCM10017774_44500 [Lentzea cavernae]